MPASLLANWKAELDRFAPTLSFLIAHPSENTTSKRPIDEQDVRGLDLLITTYGMLSRTEWLRQRDWDLVILDEAQAIKNSGTRQSRTVKELKAAARVAMTGTPVENRLSDLWSLFDFLNPGPFGRCQGVCQPGQANGGQLVVPAPPDPCRTLHPAPAQDRQASDRRLARKGRDVGLLHAEPRAGRPLSSRPYAISQRNSRMPTACSVEGSSWPSS